MPARTVLTIGNFDGVHLGHRALIGRARAIADRDGGGDSGGDGSRGRVVAISFQPHPVTVLAPEKATPPLSPFEQRVLWLKNAGADEVVRLEPTPGLLNLTPEQFVDRLMTDHHPDAIVEGPDFHFGKGRAGNVETLRELGRDRGFEVDVLEPVTTALTDQTVVTASSSIIRWLLGHGRVRDAARVLGRFYEIPGTVIRGDQRGRVLGFPTANLRSDCLAPGDGVYAAKALLPGGRVFPAAVHVGPRATFDSEDRTVEAHILNWRGPLDEGTPEYGWPLSLLMVAWIRGQVRFDSADALVDQMRRDVDQIRDLLARELPRAVPSLQEASA